MIAGPSPLPAGLRVLELDANHVKATFVNMLLVVWRKETTLAAYQRVAPKILELARAQPDGVGVLQVVEKGAIPPDADTKREFLKVLSLVEGQVKHYSVVHDGNTAGPGAHAHPEDDLFYVIEGTMSFLKGDHWIDAAKGSFLLVPGGVTYDFENRSTSRAGVLNFSIPGDFEQNMPQIVQWFAENPAGPAGESADKTL